MKTYVLIVSLFFALSLHGEEEILVRLSTETKMLPVAVFPISTQNSEISAPALDTLRSVLVFDMNINGMTEVVPTTTSAISSLIESEKEFNSATDYTKWKEAQIPYCIKLEAKNKELSVKLVSINSKSIKLIEGIHLTGDPVQDRTIMHRISDGIFEILFQKKGIATSHILYTVRHKVATDEGEWTSEIFEADYDGKNPRQISFENTYLVTPAYTTRADNATLLYVSYKIGQPKIFYKSAKEKKARRLTTLRGNQLTPQISPDASKIAFTSDVTGSADLFFVHFHPTGGALGKPRQIFTAKGTTCASPTFSPDGSKIAFVCNKDGSPKIYVMDIPPEDAVIKDVHPKLISKRCRENSAPCWSLDGKKIVYSAKSGGSRQLWLYNFETQEERQLTDGPGDKENPSFAPDSCHIIFNSSEGASTELYLMNINQKKCVKITSGAGEKRFPCWK